MPIKLIVFFTLFFGALQSVRAQEPGAFDPHNWQPPYFLDTPRQWGTERFLIPIVYKGVEDIRFAPGWAKKESEEYWAYTFLWYLDGNIEMDEKIIEKNLAAYYNWLLHANLDSAKIAESKIGTTKSSARPIKAVEKAKKSFEATVNTWDYMTRQPMQLHLRIHIHGCKEENKTFVFHEVSPQPYSHTIWTSLHALWLGLRCKR